MLTLKQRLQLEREIAAKVASGKLQDTGKKYSSEEAQRDSTNETLRMAAKVENGQLSWERK